MIHKPSWLKVNIPSGENYKKVKSILKEGHLHTICEEAKCPNIAECFNHKSATFLILGDICTRNCKYCNVKQGKPKKVNLDEPRIVAETVKKLGLHFVVVTSVDRDDLEDGGASLFAQTVIEIKKINKKTLVELLIPDLKGNLQALKKIVAVKPDVLGHNIEVVERLFPILRPQGNYSLSIRLLKTVKDLNKKLKTKSGIMLGLGEEKKDILKTMEDLRKADVDFLTIGQYLRPNKDLAEVKHYYHPSEFEDLKNIGLEMGFKNVIAGPLVRSSYRAERLLKKKV